LVLLDEGFIACLLDVPRDLVDRLIPGDVFPFLGAGSPNLRLRQTAFVENLVVERGSLRAQRAAIDGMIGIALDVNHLGGHVLGFVTKCVDDHAATDRAIRTSGTRFGGARDLQFSGLRENWTGIKTQQQRRGSSAANLKKLTSG